MKKIIIGVVIIATVILISIFFWRYTPLKDGQYSVSNKTLTWYLEVSNGVLRTTSIENLNTKETLTVTGNDFAIRVGNSNTLWRHESLRRPEDKWAPYGTKDGKIIRPKNCRAVMRIRGLKTEKFVIYNPYWNCNIYLEFDKSTSMPWMTRQLSVQGCDPKLELAIDDMANHVEWRYKGKTSHGGKGQPLFCDDSWFMALEHPWSDNVCDNGVIKMTQYPGLCFTNNLITLNSMVVGGGAGIPAREAFNDYFKSFRRTPRSVSLYNTWNDWRGDKLTEANIVSSAAQIQKELNKRGSKLDFCVIDDGWQNRNSIWKTDLKKIPGDLKGLSRKLKKKNIKAGLWLSLSGFYIDNKWAVANGYDPPHSKYLCMSSPKYNQELRKVLTSVISTGKIAYFKHDFNYFECGKQHHGHFLNRDHSIEYNINEEIDILKYERSLNSNIYQAITSGINPSPWWYEYVDTVWMGGADQSYASQLPYSLGSAQEMNYRDAALYNLLEVKKLIFPLYGIMTHGIIDGKIVEYNMTKESNESWDNYAMNYFGRGTMMRELYFTPELITSTRWNTIARGLEWAKSLDKCFENAHFFLGSPAKGELYGFTGQDKDYRYISIRNPAIAPVEISFKDLLLTNEMVEIIYPWHQYLAGDQLDKIQIAGEMVFQAESYLKSSLNRPVPVGVRSSLSAYKDTWTEYNIYPTSPNQKFDIVSPIKITAMTGVVAHRNDGKNVKLKDNMDIPEWNVISDFSSLSNGSFQISFKQRGLATTHIKTLDYSPRIPLQISLNDKKKAGKVFKGGNWRVVNINGVEGKNIIDFKYKNTNGQRPIKQEVYCISERTLPVAKIRITHAKAPAPKAFRKLQPLRQRIERKTSELRIKR